jgi:antitoxin ParD1/3/4
MRTNIDIDDATLDAAMKAGSFKTKKEAVDAGLRLLARQAAYREVLQWEGRLHWDGDVEGPAPRPRRRSGRPAGKGAAAGHGAERDPMARAASVARSNHGRR